MRDLEFSSGGQEFAPVGREFAAVGTELSARGGEQSDRGAEFNGGTVKATSKKKKRVNPLLLVSAAVVTVTVVLGSSGMSSTIEQPAYLELESSYCDYLDNLLSALDSGDTLQLETLAHDPRVGELIRDVLPAKLAQKEDSFRNFFTWYLQNEGAQSPYAYYTSRFLYDGNKLYPVYYGHFASTKLEGARDLEFQVHYEVDETTGEKTVLDAFQVEETLSSASDGTLRKTTRHYYLTRPFLETPLWRLANTHWDTTDVYVPTEGRYLFSYFLTHYPETTRPLVWLIEGTFQPVMRYRDTTDGEALEYFDYPMENGSASLCPYDGAILGDPIATITVQDGRIQLDDQVQIESQTLTTSGLTSFRIYLMGTDGVRYYFEEATASSLDELLSIPRELLHLNGLYLHNNFW